MRHHIIKGFTLIEMLIALVIFSVVMVVTSMGLRTVLNTQQKMQQPDQRLRELLIASSVMQMDYRHIINRAVLSNSGKKLPGFIMHSPSVVEFTRSGGAMPQRLTYAYRQHALHRITWPVLDRMAHTIPRDEVLLSNIDDARFECIGKKSDGFPRVIILKIRFQRDAFSDSLSMVFPVVVGGERTDVTP